MVSLFTLNFYKGTITVSGDYYIPYTKWDERTNSFRGLAMHYRDIIDYLESSDIAFKDNVLDLIPCPELSCVIQLRNYQEDALERWLTDKKGVVVLPTGAGKTHLGIAVIKELDCSTFIVVPTLDLVDQWKRQLERFKIVIGEYTGNKKDLKAITVSTYDSAYLNAENLGNKFKLIIFDEVHHLPSEGYRHIAEFFASPYRLGLTATYEREDGLHERLPRLVGGKVYEIKTKELAGKHLSDYRLEKIEVDLTPAEKKEYGLHDKKFKNFLRRSKLKMRGPGDFQKIVMRSGTDRLAWEAVRSKNKATRIAYNSEGKIKKLRKLLERHKDDRIIIFTRYNDLVYRISNDFLIPNITHKTGKDERIEVIEKFRKGVYSAIVSSQVLDEGVDVPDANVGIIMSGTGSNREFVQRLGRILRPAEKEAILYEIVSTDTSEIRTSYRRKRGLN